ncbi:MAG: PorT family protein [Prevotellaceae bacterium]|jgi:opacity protein-like surface antigen|nr:PorT family protein [Prevotellaceae bacterium]
MKKFSVILAALLMTLGANAQDKPVKFGVKAGVNLSSVSSIKVSGGGQDEPLLEGDGMSVGFHAGGFLNYSFGQYFGIQPELLFSMQGGKQKSPGNDPLKTSLSLSYINIPILFEVKPITGLSLLVGPQIGLNVSRSGKLGDTNYSGSKFDELTKDSFGCDFKKFDFSIALGLQYALPMNIYLGARYNLGVIAPINYSESGITVSGWKHNVIQLSVGYAF